MSRASIRARVIRNWTGRSGGPTVGMSPRTHPLRPRTTRFPFGGTAARRAGSLGIPRPEVAPVRKAFLVSPHTFCSRKLPTQGSAQRDSDKRRRCPRPHSRRWRGGTDLVDPPVQAGRPLHARHPLSADHAAATRAHPQPAFHGDLHRHGGGPGDQGEGYAPGEHEGCGLVLGARGRRPGGRARPPPRLRGGVGRGVHRPRLHRGEPGALRQPLPAAHGADPQVARGELPGSNGPVPPRARRPGAGRRRGDLDDSRPGLR